MFGNSEHTLWVEKYRPTTLEGYIGNESIIDKVKIYIASGDVPHLLLYGDAGTGKTTLAKIVATNVDADVMYINASDENNVDTVREKIKSFASTIGFKTWKIIILDESDYLTPNAQAALRNLMETFSKTTRFVLTCNYVEKIIDPIQSRCQTFSVFPPSKKDVAVQMSKILELEKIKYTPVDLATIINAGYPDIRRILNSCQRQVVAGELKIDKQSLIESNYMVKLLEILTKEQDKKIAFTTIRQLLADSQVKSFESLYRYLYDNLDEWAKGHIAPCILIIAETQYKDTFCVDKEINVMSMFIQLINEIK